MGTAELENEELCIVCVIRSNDFANAGTLTCWSRSENGMLAKKIALPYHTVAVCLFAYCVYSHDSNRFRLLNPGVTAATQ